MTLCYGTSLQVINNIVVILSLINITKNAVKPSFYTAHRFHAYAVIVEMDSYEGQVVHPNTNQANIPLKRRTYSWAPPGAGMREDVIVLFEELEEARNNLAQIQALIDEYPEPKPEGEYINAVCMYLHFCLLSATECHH